MAMKRIGIYGIVIIFGLLGCEKESDWEGGTSNTEGLKRVSIQMAIEEGASFEKYIHSLAVFAFQETDDSFVYYKKVADLTAGDSQQQKLIFLASLDNGQFRLNLCLLMLHILTMQIY